jgi:5-methylcytosine-specific restriction endonuclease McrA
VTVKFGGRPWARQVKLVLARDGASCRLGLPGCTIRATTADHILPRSHGGSNDLPNLRAACNHCNKSRKDRPLEALRPFREIYGRRATLRPDYTAPPLPRRSFATIRGDFGR